MIRTTHPFPRSYSGTSGWTECVFLDFSVCSHVYLLNYRSELVQIWRQDTDTIHDHYHTPPPPPPPQKKKKKNSTQVRSAIMGRNGRVVLGAHFQMVFRTDGRQHPH